MYMCMYVCVCIKEEKKIFFNHITDRNIPKADAAAFVQ